MKRIIAAVVLTLIAVWVINDAITATRMASTAFRQQSTITMYEHRHGTMTDDQRRGYIDNAYQACSYLDSNPSLPDLYMAMTDSGISSDAAVTTIEAAITNLCTEHKPLLEEADQ